MMGGETMMTDVESPSIADLYGLVKDLTHRVEELEAELASRPAATAAGGAEQKPAVVSEEVVLAISAAVAAFLGKRATIKQIHFTGTTAWAQQGRGAVQSSHSPAHDSW